MAADMIFTNGEVITADGKNTIADSVVIRDNKIVYVGNAKEAETYGDSSTKRIDLKGRSLLPGFIDAHLHMGVLGTNMMAIDCRSPKMKSIEDIKKAISEVAEKTPKGEWIRAWGYDHTKLKENRHPTRWDLDEAAPNHPVMLTRTCAHISVHNSLSLAIAGVDDTMPDPKGGVMERENGKLNGVMKENAHMDMMKVCQPTIDELKQALSMADKELIKQGITSVHDSGGYGPIQMRAFQEAVADGTLNVRIYSMIFSFIDNVKFVKDLLKVGVHTGCGDEKFRLGPAKIMIDGSSSGPTAATRKPYTSDPNFSGIMSMTQEEIDEIVSEAHQKGWQMTCHAVGDRAVDAILSAYEKAYKALPEIDGTKRRHRIEHCAIMDEGLLRRVKDLGIVPIPQPIFLYEFGDGYMVNYGKERVDCMFPCRSFLDKDILAAGSSDCPITTSEPIMGIYMAVNRKTITGQRISQEQRIGLLEAVKMFTYNGAYASYEEHIKGSIEPGKLADLVVLSESLLNTEPEKIKELGVDMTIIDGQIRYEK